MKVHSTPHVGLNLMMAGFVCLAAGCSRGLESTPVISTEAATAAAPSVSDAVQTPAEAELAAKRALEAPGFEWIESPRVVLVDEMDYAEAVRRIGLGDGQYEVWPAESRVWLVIFQGRWLLTPMGPSQPPPQPIAYEGCLMTVLAASDGTRISAGDAVCPGP